MVSSPTGYTNACNWHFTTDILCHQIRFANKSVAQLKAVISLLQMNVVAIILINQRRNILLMATESYRDVHELNRALIERVRLSN